METQPKLPEETSAKKKNTIWIVVGFVVLLAIIALLAIMSSNQKKQHDKELSDLQLKYQQDLNRLSMANSRIDSLYKVAIYLNKYRGLVESAYTRDSSRLSIPHVIGDIVMLKVDSSKVVITDIVVGGGLFEYYVRYRVQHKDRTVEEVAPEMIF